MILGAAKEGISAVKPKASPDGGRSGYCRGCLYGRCSMKNFESILSISVCKEG